MTRYSWTAARGFYPDPVGVWRREVVDGGAAGAVVVFTLVEVAR